MKLNKPVFTQRARKKSIRFRNGDLKQSYLKVIGLGTASELLPSEVSSETDFSGLRPFSSNRFGLLETIINIKQANN